MNSVIYGEIPANEIVVNSYERNRRLHITENFNIEEFDPDPFMEALNKWGLPWEEDFNPVLVD